MRALATSADFSSGFFAPVRGFMIILRNPRLLPYCIFPFILTFIAVAVWIFAGWYLATASAGWVSDLVDNSVLQWIIYIPAILVAIVLAIVLALVIFFVFIQVIAAPFNTILAERTETILNCSVPVLEQNFWRENLSAIWVSVILLARSLAVSLFLLPLNFLPVVGTFVYVPLTTFFNSQTLGFEFMDYSLERRYTTFKERLGWIKAHRSAAVGLGFAVSLTLFLPVINLFFIPFCVVGGTELFVRLAERDARLAENDPPSELESRAVSC